MILNATEMNGMILNAMLFNDTEILTTLQIITQVLPISTKNTMVYSIVWYGMVWAMAEDYHNISSIRSTF